MRSLPAGCFSSHQVSTGPYRTATAAHASANPTAWSTKKSMILRSSRPSQSERRVASARRIMYHKRSGRSRASCAGRTTRQRATRSGSVLPKGRRGGSRLGDRPGIGELQVRPRLLEVADDLLLDASFPRTGSSARSASIASLACVRSRASARAGGSRARPSRRARSGGCRTTPTLSSALRSSSSVGGPPPPDSACVSSPTDPLRCADLLGVDLLERRSLLEARDLALGRVPLGHREIRRRADLLGRRAPPTRAAPRSAAARESARRGRSRAARRRARSGSRARSSPRSAGAAAAHAARPRRMRARDPRGERGGERRERLRLAEVGLAVADADLDGREREVRAHAPPDLRVLRDRAGVVEEADEALELVPGGERVGDAAAREEAREDLRPRRVQAGVRRPRRTASSPRARAARAGSSAAPLTTAIARSAR